MKYACFALGLLLGAAGAFQYGHAPYRVTNDGNGLSTVHVCDAAGGTVGQALGVGVDRTHQELGVECSAGANGVMLDAMRVQVK